MRLKSYLTVLFSLTFIWIGSSQAQAHCFLPDGEEGDSFYNVTESLLQGCTDFGWQAWNTPGSGGGGCTNPVGAEGDMTYNSTSEIFQACTPNGWQALHITPSGGGGCADPVGVTGDVVYNTTHRTFQGCTPHGWYAFHKIPVETKVTASDAAASDFFGKSVSVFGGVSAIGAWGDNGGGGINSGSAYIFRDSGGGSWTEEAKLSASDGTDNDLFGGSVSVLGDVAIVGAMFANGNTSQSGKAYAYRHTGGGVWVEEAMLEASDGSIFDAYGRSVSLSTTATIIGAQADDDDGSNSGSAYVFRDTGGGVWTEEAKLTASDAAADDQFGFAVSMSGDLAVIGAANDDDDGNESGSAYIFRHAGGGVWNQEAKLTASDAAADDQFGYSVSISGDLVAIGSWQDDDGGNESGSAYIFSHTGGGVWTQQVKLNALDKAAGDQFGSSASVSGNVAVIGSFQDDDNGSGSGSVYFYQPVP